MNRYMRFFYTITLSCKNFLKKLIYPRMKLRAWAEFEGVRQDIQDAADRKHWQKIPPLLEQATNTRGKPWFYTVQKYMGALEANQPTKPFSILNSKGKADRQPWEYPGRVWYFWCNLFASHYGWSEKTIASLSLDDAIGLFQEIQVDNYFRQEWEHSLSDKAYEYVKSSKTTRYVPLPKPDWMLPTLEERNRPPKATMIRKDMMPQGVIVILD